MSTVAAPRSRESKPRESKPKESKPKEAKSKEAKEDKSKVHKLSLKGSSKLCVEFFEFATNTILFQRGVYPPEDFSPYVLSGNSNQLTADSVPASRSMA
jgi:mitotic spindle assembly checkpoint protein MAD2